MYRWKTVLAQVALAGSVASLLATALLSVADRRRCTGTAAPLADALPGTPEGCTSGAECRLSSGAMLGVCAAFAVGLVATTLGLREQHQKQQPETAPMPEEADEAPPLVRRVRAGQMR